MNNDVFFIILGIVFVLLPCLGVFDKQKQNLKKHGKSVTATVINYEKVSSGDGYNWEPVLEYEVNGTKFWRRGNGHIIQIYEIGQRIELIYEENNPNNFMIDTVRERNSEIGMTVLFIVIGVGLLVWPLFLRDAIGVFH